MSKYDKELKLCQHFLTVSVFCLLFQLPFQLLGVFTISSCFFLAVIYFSVAGGAWMSWEIIYALAKKEDKK